MEDAELASEYELDSSILDAAHFVSWALEKLLPEETFFEMYMEQPWRPAWKIVVPEDEDVEAADDLAFATIAEVYAQQHILIGYCVQH